jgi:hypothetical protein
VLEPVGVFVCLWHGDCSVEGGSVGPEECRPSVMETIAPSRVNWIVWARSLARSTFSFLGIRSQASRPRAYAHVRPFVVAPAVTSQSSRRSAPGVTMGASDSEAPAGQRGPRKGWKTR